MGDVEFPINYNTEQVSDICRHMTRSQIKEFGRSFIHNTAMLFGMGHAADYKFGKGDLILLMTNMKKDMEKKKWEITQNLFQKQYETDRAIIQSMNELLITLQQHSNYYDSIFEPQFQRINLLDNFRLSLLLFIIFVLITFIDWK